MTEREESMLTGGCLCGHIRYRFLGPPLLTAVCHCRHCQKQSGSAFSIVCATPSDGYGQSGTTAIFADTGDSGKRVMRHFCPHCGSPIVSLAEAFPGLTIIKAGTLDDPDQIKPTVEAYCDSAWKILPPLEGTQRFSRSNI